MSDVDPVPLATLVRTLHGYELEPPGAARTAEMVAAIAAALTAIAPQPQFHEEPAAFALTLAALAPEEC